MESSASNITIPAPRSFTGALMDRIFGRPHKIEFTTPAAIGNAPAIFRFRCFSLTNPPSAESEQAFLAQMNQLGNNPSGGAGLSGILDELNRKDLPQTAKLLAHYLDNYSKSPALRTLDNWLSLIAERSPETYQHICRQSVLVSLIAEAATASAPKDQADALRVNAILAATAHDLGKLAIDPALLHKSTRVNRAELETFIVQYQQHVPDSPGKLEEMEFLRMMNGGRIAFDIASSGDAVYPLKECLARINAAPLLGEPEFADDALKLSNHAHYENIKTKAKAAGIAWLPESLESALLNQGRRGTLTSEEMNIIHAHDHLSVRLFDQSGLGQILRLSPETVDMDKSATAALANDPVSAQLRQWIQLSDMLEATTGQRAYNRENGKNLTTDEALQVLEGAVSRGALDAATLDQFKQSGVAARYSALYRDIPKDRTHVQPVISAQGAEQSVLAAAPIIAPGITK